MKYKIGDLIIWDGGLVIAQILDITEKKYLYKIINHYYEYLIGHIIRYDKLKLERMTRTLTDEEKLELL